MVKKIFILWLFTISSLCVLSQEYVVSGKVLDATTGRSLAFVNIVTNQSNIGTATDIDGKFELSATSEVEFLRLSYLGYEAQTFYLHGQYKNLEISLVPTSFDLEEVVIVAGENPAHRIIRHVIENRDKNDPEKLSSFAYTSYDKMIMTVDTLTTAETNTNPEDSSYIRLKNFLSDKDFFMMETVAEHKFMYPDRKHDKILASRISGFKDPVLLFLSSQLQSSTFYRELIKISDKNYINPISRGSLKKYFFQLEDTTYTGRGDSVYIISFRPGINTNFDGLTGVLWINTRSWAIQNVIAGPTREEAQLSIKIQQMYELIDDSIWFPVQLNTDVIFNNVRVNNFVPVGKGKSYNQNIELNPELVKRQFNQNSIEFDPGAASRSEDFWLAYRGDSLTRRERRTYTFIDSIGHEAKLDKKIYTLKALMNNRLPLGKIDLDLSKIAKYNSFEGMYLGLGLLTSKKLSQTIGAGAFVGYGFKDKTMKYGGEFSLTFDRYRDIKLNLAYFDYATETGEVMAFEEKENVLNPANFRNFLIKDMDQTERMKASFSFRALRYGIFNAGITKDRKRVTNNYYFDDGKSDIPTTKPVYCFTEFTAGIRYTYKEKYLQMPDGQISLGTNHPVIWFRYTRGLGGTLDGEYDYNKFDLKVEKSFFLKYLGKSKVELLAGYIDQPVPQANLYNGRGAYRVFTLNTTISFATQRMNEFLANKYVFLFYTHNFGSLLWRGKRFSPEIAVATNAGFATLAHPEYHKGIDFKVMDKGYFESGILINRLLNFNGVYTIGVGVFYRYGFYHLPDIADNFAYKLSIVIPF